MLGLATKLGRPARVWPDTAFFNKLCADPNWAAEPKKNGWRLLAVIRPDQSVQIITRHGRELKDPKYGELRGALGKLPPDSWFDGELMPREGRVWLFDALRLRGEMFTAHIYKDRQAAVEFLCPSSGPVQALPSTTEGKFRMFSEALHRGDEGVVFKHLCKPYPWGDTRYWIKARLSNL